MNPIEILKTALVQCKYPRAQGTLKRAIEYLEYWGYHTKQNDPGLHCVVYGPPFPIGEFKEN